MLNLYMCAKLCLPVTFLPPEHGSVELSTSSIPRYIPLLITPEDVRELSAELYTLGMRAQRDDMTKELAFFLRTLWDQIDSPIVNCLETIHSSQSRIWWCPSGEFSVLPLHTAERISHISTSRPTPQP